MKVGTRYLEIQNHRPSE